MSKKSGYLPGSHLNKFLAKIGPLILDPPQHLFYLLSFSLSSLPVRAAHGRTMKLASSSLLCGCFPWASCAAWRCSRWRSGRRKLCSVHSQASRYNTNDHSPNRMPLSTFHTSGTIGLLAHGRTLSAAVHLCRVMRETPEGVDVMH